MASEPPDEEAPGWDAIDQALRSQYGAQEPKHWSAVLPAMLGGNDPLQGISIYAHDTAPRHWHFVTFGLSELYDKTWDDPDVSGFGFEFTFRLTRDEESEPPSWCFSFLQNLGRYVFSTGNVFASGHYLDLNGPIALGSPTHIRAIVFLEDPVLGSIATQNGRVRFLQIVGLTLDELAAVKRWDSAKFLDTLTNLLPLGTTDLERISLLEDADIAHAVDQGILTDGSSTGVLYVSSLSWRQEKRLLRRTQTNLVLGANGTRDFGPVLLARVPFGRPLSLVGPDSVVVFEPADAFDIAIETADDFSSLHVRLTAAQARMLGTLVRPVAGSYSHPDLPGLRVSVERSVIKTSDGQISEAVG